MSKPMLKCDIKSLPLISRGKVRDNFAVGDSLILMVATDRLSAFDVVLENPIPGKGQILTRMALFWFSRLAHIVPNHLTGLDPLDCVNSDERDAVNGRAMLVKRLKPLPIEAVVRGYLAGSAWSEYKRTGAVCGNLLPPGLLQASKLTVPIFTPATKAEKGGHDININFQEMEKLIGAELAANVARISISLYTEAANFAIKKGLIIADTKFEFGLNEKEELVLMDEILTPDSSRYWTVDEYGEGKNPPSYDKQYLRDWLESATVDGELWNKMLPAPHVPDEVLKLTARKYSEALRRITE